VSDFLRERSHRFPTRDFLRFPKTYDRKQISRKPEREGVNRETHGDEEKKIGRDAGKTREGGSEPHGNCRKNRVA